MSKQNYFLRLKDVKKALESLKSAAAGDGSHSPDTILILNTANHFGSMLRARQFFYGEKWTKEVRNASHIATEVYKEVINLDKLIPLTAELYKDMDNFASEITIDEVLNV